MSREQRQRNGDRIADRQATRSQKGQLFNFEQYSEDFFDVLARIESCPVTTQGKPLKRTLHTR